MLSIITRKFPPGLIRKNSNAGVELALLPSKLVETNSPISSAEHRSWRIQCYMRTLPPVVKRCLWSFLPILVYAIFYNVCVNIESYGIASLFHFAFFYAIAKPAVFFIAFSVVIGLLISTISALPGVQSPFPSRIFLNDEGFSPWDTSCLIPWKNIRSVTTRQLIYKGSFRTNVLEIDAQYQNQSVLKRIQRFCKVDGLRRTHHFYDPIRNNIPEDKGAQKNDLRIPLEMFAFENDKQRFLAALREHVDPALFNCDVELISELDVIAADSFTQLWLTDLRGVGNVSSPRVMESGRELQNGKYKITGVLGFGSYSVVYVASMKSDGIADGETTVAIKELVINSGGTRASKEAILKHVLVEVEILRKIDHPNIVKCLDFFVENGKIYVVLEGIIASNLRELVTQTGKWDEEKIISAAMQCCSILHYLHSLPTPIIHRDFTPDNLILDPETDSIKLIDFNVAEEANANSSQTIVGKQCYMAPEQWCGQFTTSGDLYQLGCTMFFLATGSEPEPLTQATLDTSLGLSNRLCQVIKRLTEREPEARYTSATGLSEELTSICPGRLPAAGNTEEPLPAKYATRES